MRDRALALHFRLLKGGWTIRVEAKHTRWSWLVLAWWDPWVWYRVFLARPPFRSPYQDRERWRATWLFFATNEWTNWRLVMPPWVLAHIVLSDHGLSRRDPGQSWRFRDTLLAPWDPWGWWCLERATREAFLALRAVCAARGHRTWNPTHGSFRHDWYRCRCGAYSATLEQMVNAGAVRYDGALSWVQPRRLSVQAMLNRMAMPAPDRVKRRWLRELDARMDKGAGIWLQLWRGSVASIESPWGNLYPLHRVRVAVDPGSPVNN